MLLVAESVLYGHILFFVLPLTSRKIDDMLIVTECHAVGWFVVFRAAEQNARLKRDW